MFVTKFQDAALRLSLDDRVSVLGRGQAGAGGVIIEKVRVQVEGVEQVKLQNIDQVNADLLANFYLYGMVLIMERDPVDRVEIIFVIEVHIETVHYHHHFAVDRWAASLGIDDESAVEAFRDV